MTVDGQLISQIARGILVFAAVDKNDTPKEAESMASKVLKMKLWEDEAGVKWKKNVQDIEGEVLCGSRSPSNAAFRRGERLIYGVQYLNSHYSHQRKRATSPTFTSRHPQSKARNSTTPSSPKSASSTAKTESKMAYSKP